MTIDPQGIYETKDMMAQDITVKITISNVVLTPGVRKNIAKTLRKTGNALPGDVKYEIFDIFKDPPKSQHTVMFLCDGKACDPCNNEGCTHTTDPNHALNFKLEGPDSDWYVEQERKEHTQ